VSYDCFFYQTNLIRDNIQVLEAYVDELDFQKLDLTEALRYSFTRHLSYCNQRKFMCNFAPPGIGQLGTLMEKFAKAYLKQNPDAQITSAGNSPIMNYEL
jgi:Sec7-like guanine-nucleotide exchange factor